MERTWVVEWRKDVGRQSRQGFLWDFGWLSVCCLKADRWRTAVASHVQFANMLHTACTTAFVHVAVVVWSWQLELGQA